jgi:hypothetical protein
MTVAPCMGDKESIALYGDFAGWTPAVPPYTGFVDSAPAASLLAGLVSEGDRPFRARRSSLNC